MGVRRGRRRRPRRGAGQRPAGARRRGRPRHAGRARAGVVLAERPTVVGPAGARPGPLPGGGVGRRRPRRSRPSLAAGPRRRGRARHRAAWSSNARRAALAWTSWGPGGERRLAVGAAAPTRGASSHLGPPWVRAHGPLGLVRWQGAVGPPCTIRVAAVGGHARGPCSPTPTRGPPPAPTSPAGRATASSSPRPAPTSPGDRLRSVNWALSTRRGELWVNERRPERSARPRRADRHLRRRPPGRRRWRWPARLGAAWLLAAAHLRRPRPRGPRRASVATRRGSRPAPASGRAYELLDRLLATSAAWTEAQRSVRMLPRQALPPGALVVAVTPAPRPADGGRPRRPPPAWDGGGGRARRRRPTSCRNGPIRSGRPRCGCGALELDRRAAMLGDAGIPVVTWPGATDAAQVLESLRRAVRAPVFRGRSA